MKPQAVRLDSDISSRTGMSQLVEKASGLLQLRPELARDLQDGTFELCCPCPSGYRPSMNSWATQLTARINETGWLFEISESLPQGCSGGWMASCIPPSMFRTFLSAWISFASKPADPSVGTPVQLDLFAA